MTTRPYAVRIVCIACRQTSRQVYADSNIHTDLQMVTSARHYADRIVCTVYAVKWMLSFIQTLCKQDCTVYTIYANKGRHSQTSSHFTDNDLFFYIRTITFAQIHAGDKIYMALCKHDCLCYLCRQKFARIYTDSKYCTDLCRCWHLGEVMQTRLSFLLMQTRVCSCRHLSALLRTDSIKPIRGAFSFLTVAIVLPPAWK